MKIMLLIFAIFAVTFSQSGEPCPEQERKQFDFWIGDWELSWTGRDGKMYEGENRISYIFDGCVVEERFHSFADGFKGISHSVYVPQQQVWKQTWVSSTGGYLDFVGTWEDDRMILSRNYTEKNGDVIHQRMIWHNIEEDKFDWHWEKSTDGGKTWNLLWEIKYKRK